MTAKRAGVLVRHGATGVVAPDRMFHMYVRKEAVLSSSIEGTKSTLTDLLEYENEAVPGTHWTT